MQDKFDCVIQNPPYAGHFHLSFLKKGMNILNGENGKMTIIEPATWLINIRRNGKCDIYDDIKRKVNGHVRKVIIENYNTEFGTDTFVPFAITYIDMSKTFDTIDFICFGHHQKVKSIYDCNLIGDHKVVLSILRKAMKYGDMMESHVTDKEIQGYHYMPYNEIIGPTGYHIDFSYKTTPHGQFSFHYLSFCMHKTRADINDKIVNKANGNSDTAVYGTADEIENWRHYIMNNKLPLFINLCISFDHHNQSKPYIPFIVDKQYTDDEIFKMLKLKKSEIDMIDKTLKKFERYSPWWKRYCCGKDSATDKEVTEFVESL